MITSTFLQSLTTTATTYESSVEIRFSDISVNSPNV
jgi:hypothetical protein